MALIGSLAGLIVVAYTLRALVAEVREELNRIWRR